MKPSFVAQAVPPMVMFDVSRDHKLYYVAYNDGVDLNDDGRIDNAYNHSIEYYGYFNPYKCYTYDSSGYFTPAATTTDRFCSSGQWGGNIMNWLTMSRMDVLRKVMYGGQRSQETPRVLLNRAYIPQDAHSWGKEYTGKLCGSGTTYKQMCSTDNDCDSGYTCQNKSVNLIGVAAPAGGTSCAASVTGPVSWGSASSDPGKEKLLVVRYPNTNGTNATDHNTLVAGFDTTQFYTSGGTAVLPFYVTDFSDTNLDAAQNHGDNYAQVIVGEFTVGKVSNTNDINKPGTWTFAIDGDDGVELEIRKTSDGNILQSTNSKDQLGWYGGHGRCNCQDKSDTWTLAANTRYRLIVRHAEGGGNDGVKVWYKFPGGSTWRVAGTGGTGNEKVVFNAPNIYASGSADNSCTLLSETFRDTGTPTATTVATAQKYHLFCNTTLSAGVPSSSAASQTTLLRMITNSSHRIWEWSLKESPVCSNTFEDGTSASTNRTDYTVKVEVCKSGVGTLSEKNLFERCRNYGGTYNSATDTYTGGSWMPIGLFQKYGEYDPNDGTGITRVCSKTMGKACSTDNDCGTGEGLCFDKSQMYFGMMSTTYTNNTSGGVLRKNPGPVSDEVNMNNGTQQTSENDRGNLIHSMDRMVVIGYDYGSRTYANCGWIWDRPIDQGECKMWGNPIAELMYESLRYFAGKGTPTSDFKYLDPADSGVSLSKPNWGYKIGSNYYQPFDIFPSCSQPFLLVLSDVNTSYDSDQIPGSAYSSFAEDALSPKLGLGDVDPDTNKTLLDSLLDTISSVEGVDGGSWFIGESDGSTDFICSAKTVTNLHSVRGTCPEEPTKKGSYYAAALAYYGKTMFKDVTGTAPVSTFVVALESPFSDIKVRAGGNLVSIVPVAKTVNGSKCLGYNGCTYTTDDDGRLIFSGCPSTSFCPTNSLVGLYINDVKYNSSNEIIYMKFRQNFEDVEQGADHDMDAIATYEICTAAAATAGYGSCASLTLSSNQLEVDVTSSYASGSADQILGFIISGTTEDGTYLVVKDKDVGSGSQISSFPLEWKNKIFTSSSTPSASYLKSPLWYAAKWGGFTGNGIPDSLLKWDKNGDGNPDSYFPVSNPLLLDQQLEKALQAILARVSSGTAASILNNSEGSGASLLQAVFYPKKEFDNDTEAEWIGELHNMWYYIDPFLQLTSIREDSNGDYKLSLKDDNIAQFVFDAGQNKTSIQLYKDANGDGSPDDSENPTDTVDSDAVKSLWKAGRKLWARNLADSKNPRTIYTRMGSSGLTLFSIANKATLRPYLQAADDTESENIIKYVHGFDSSDINASSPPNYRNRTVTIKNCGLTDSQGCTRPWKLGDIVSSTPRIVSNVNLNSYANPMPNGYADNSYKMFYKSSTYKNRGMVFVGGNDGMLHAFKLGLLKELNGRFDKAQFNNTSGSLATAADNLGYEEWSFIPQQSLPYLTYLKNPEYCHLHYVDKTPTIFDVNIEKPSGCTEANYWDCAKPSDGSNWRTILIGGNGVGGAPKWSGNTAYSSQTGEIRTAVTPVSGSGESDALGYSSYFALDVTDPAAPVFKWEFPGTKSAAAYQKLGYSTTGPAIVRISAKKKDGSGNDTVHPNHAHNGRWFAVFASGPTGPIDTNLSQFKGQSDQKLRIFVVDMSDGTLVRTIDTFADGTSFPTEAFAGSLATSWLDSDRATPANDGWYSDDAIYVGYTRKCDTSVDNGCENGSWTRGGVIRLLTKELIDPTGWAASHLIKDVGPVTTSVTKLQDRKKKNLWVYFGTGRYFFKNDTPTQQQTLYGIKDPCYVANKMNGSCTDSANTSKFVDQSGSESTAPTATLDQNTITGWFVNLDTSAGSFSSERVITDPLASTAGAVFFTTFAPSNDVCKFGGDSYIWALRYDTGGMPPGRAMQGKALMQVSTGAFAEISLKDAFKSKDGNQREEGRKLNVAISGVPPTAQGLSLITNPPPVKKILHVREK